MSQVNSKTGALDLDHTLSSDDVTTSVHAGPH